jgi:hypothetical protein
MLPPDAAAGPARNRAQTTLWRDLVQEERVSGGVVVEGPTSNRLLAFGLTAFVDERFLSGYLEAPRPYLAPVLYETVRSQRSVLLDPAAVRQANGLGGLNLVILHFRLAPGLEPTTAHGAVASAEAGFRLAHSGYRVRRVLQEARGPYERSMIASAGLRIKSDYSCYFSAGGAETPPVDERPVLMGLYADDPESLLLGTTAGALFHHSRPRFYFSLGEQRILGRAVLDESDEEIARELGLSLAAVKKSWRRAYERVTEEEPKLLEGETRESGSTRGKEKRRNLIRYLRYNLHELRPMPRPPKRSSGR